MIAKDPATDLTSIKFGAPYRGCAAGRGDRLLAAGGPHPAIADPRWTRRNTWKRPIWRRAI